MSIGNFHEHFTDLIYSGAKPFSALYTILHVWYCTRLGNVNHLSSLKRNSEGVYISALRIVRPALFWSFTILSMLNLEQWPQIKQHSLELAECMNCSIDSCLICQYILIQILEALSYVLYSGIRHLSVCPSWDFYQLRLPEVCVVQRFG